MLSRVAVVVGCVLGGFVAGFGAALVALHRLFGGEGFPSVGITPDRP